MATTGVLYFHGLTTISLLVPKISKFFELGGLSCPQDFLANQLLIRM
jgi:hypothetical protein